MKSNVVAAALLAIVWTGLHPGPASAQQTTVLQGDPECPACSIEVEHALSIGALDLPFSIGGFPPSAVLSSQGDAFVTLGRGDRVARFDAVGRLLDTLGRPGEGPGEFGWIAHLLMVEGDTLVVFDRGLRRATFFDDAGRPARTFPARTAGFQALRLSDGGFLVSGEIPSPGRVGLPFHRMGPDGTLGHSFGPEEVVVDPSRPSAARRKIGHASHPDRIWALRPDRYVLEEWDVEREVLLRTFDRRVSWFAHRDVELYGDGQYRSGDVDPTPFVIGVWEDEDGLVWVASAVATEDLADAQRLAQATPDDPRLDESRTFYDTRVEVIDPATGTVLADHVLPERGWWIAEPGVLMTYRENHPARGEVMDFWRFRLSR